MNDSGTNYFRALRKDLLWRFCFAVLWGFRTAAAGSVQEDVTGKQWNEYKAEIPKSIVELQPFRQSSTIRIQSDRGTEGSATLVNLSPAINAWYLLRVTWNGQTSEIRYHLQNAKPESSRFLLDPSYPTGLLIVTSNGRYPCDLFGSGATNTFEKAHNSPLVYYPLCGDRIYVRNVVTGHRTTLEATTEFLREHVWGGETIISLGHILMGETHRESGTVESPPRSSRNARLGETSDNFPRSAHINPAYAHQLLESPNLGIALEAPDKTGITPGAWYPVAENPGIYVGILRPDFVDPAILSSYKAMVNPLDSVEASALCYLVAFDLDRFDLGYELGTDHPKIGWSDRVVERMRDRRLPGPDGIGSIRPLIGTGLVKPEDVRRTVATFTGGFKRAHGTFRYGDLAIQNHGSHYGFIEDGVICSKLQPGLATVFVLDDNSLGMKTWTEQDSALLRRIKYARQNGVPLVELDEASQSPVPGRLVARWGPGNWSGSETGQLRTLRSGLALQKNRGKLFLIYAVFSDATPSAMTRIFQAYGCTYAMLLDMNALEHTYLALYRKSGSGIIVDHLVKGMSALDENISGYVVPRFLGYSDNRDFFYVMLRKSRETK